MEGVWTEMELGEKEVLTDCLESLKHASEQYLRAALNADSDGLRKRFSRLALDKAEQSNAVFNMMHQAGMQSTAPAAADQVQRVLDDAKSLLEQIGGASHPVPREVGRRETQN